MNCIVSFFSRRNSVMNGAFRITNDASSTDEKAGNRIGCSVVETVVTCLIYCDPYTIFRFFFAFNLRILNELPIFQAIVTCLMHFYVLFYSISRNNSTIFLWPIRCLEIEIYPELFLLSTCNLLSARLEIQCVPVIVYPVAQNLTCDWSTTHKKPIRSRKTESTPKKSVQKYKI